MYPLAEAANPTPTRFVDTRPYPLHTLPFYDIRALQDIHDIISVEPVRPRDKVMKGMLATIGIEPGKPFNPPEKLKAAMENGVIDAYYYMQKLDTKLFASNLYWVRSLTSGSGYMVQRKPSGTRHSRCLM